MEKEYRISFGTKIFYGILAVGIFIFSLFLLSKPISKNSFIILVPLSFVIVSILIISNFIRRKISISENSILYVNLFSTKQLNFSAIKGYRLNNKIIKIEPILKNDEILTIGNYIDFKNSAEISEWLFNNFKDLDALDLETEHQKLLKDITLGFSENEREEKIQEAKKISNAYNIVGTILGFLMIFSNVKFSIIILLIIPLIGIVFLYNYELIKLISNQKRSVYGHIFIGFFTTCLFLILKSLEFKLLSLENLWLPSITICLLTFAILYFKGINKSGESVIGQTIFIIIVSIFYGFGSIRAVNCEFDKSQQFIYSATVIDRHVSYGKKTNYYIKLSTWGPQNKEENEKVSETMYYNTIIGERVNVKYKKGLFQIPWFSLSIEKE
jgi:hypothetical protein